MIVCTFINGVLDVNIIAIAFVAIGIYAAVAFIHSMFFKGK